MTFLQLLNIIRDTALAQPNVNTVVREFLDLNREDTVYSAVVIQDRDGLRDRIVEQDWNTYTFHLGYVDRLTYDESNRDDIFSTGINVINNIVASIRMSWPDLGVDVIDRFSTFNQRFTASCAGVYVVLAIQVAVSDCIDSEVTDIYGKYETKITENGHYHFVPDGRPVDEIDIVVDVESGAKPEERLVETITSNGSYHYSPTPGSVFGDATIAVSVHPSQRLIRTIEQNGLVSYSGDWRGADITVSVPQKSEESLVRTITSNGSYHYSPNPGSVFSDVGIDVSVPVPHIYPASAVTISENGTFGWIASEGTGWNEFTVITDVHPSNELSRTYTTNGTKTITGEFNGGTININVHPSASLFETYTDNGTYDISGEFNGGRITVAVSSQKPETICEKIITENGSFHYYPDSGEVFNDVHITTDVHPSQSLSRTYTTNGTKTITGEFDGGTVNVNVHPSASLTRTYTSNGTYNETGEWMNGVITVAVSSQKPEEGLVETITSNGSYSYSPTPGSVFSGAQITVSVPGPVINALVVTSNGIYRPPTGVDGYNRVTVSVHPSASLTRTYTSNGTYTETGEWKDASISVSVPTTVTVTMTQAQYDALSVKDSNTIYLIYG